MWLKISPRFSIRSQEASNFHLSLRNALLFAGESWLIFIADFTEILAIEKFPWNRLSDLGIEVVFIEELRTYCILLVFYLRSDPISQSPYKWNLLSRELNICHSSFPLAEISSKKTFREINEFFINFVNINIHWIYLKERRETDEEDQISLIMTFHIYSDFRLTLISVLVVC